MKPFKNALVLVAALAFINLGEAIAQNEIIVGPGTNTLSDALTANPGATLVLKRGGEYFVTTTIEIKEPTIIKGETEPAESKPAVVSYLAEGTAKVLFSVAADCTFQGLGIMGYSGDGQHIGPVFSTSKGYISITIDGCIIQGAKQLLSTGQDGLTIVQKNNIIFNLFATGLDSWDGFGTLWGMDKGNFKCYNNTFFMAGRVLNFGGGGPDGSEAMEHNSYVNILADTYFPSYNRDFRCKNNIFYNTQLRGYVGVRKNVNGGTTWAGDFSDWQAKEIPKTDTLSGDCPIFVHHTDTLANGSPNTVHRNVMVINNLKMYEKRVLDFYVENNITKQPFIPKTDYVFANKYGWEIKNNLLQEEGNEVDPMFAMGNIPDGAFENMFKNSKNRRLPFDLQEKGYPFDNAWRPNGARVSEFIWPLPFNFKPTNPKVVHAADDRMFSGTDKYPLGDLNWFGKDLVKAWEEGKPCPLLTDVISNTNTNKFNVRNFPNPASNFSNITYNLPKNSDVSLSVYNAAGIEVANWVEKNQSVGNQTIKLSTTSFSNGIYYYVLNVDGLSQMGKIIIAK